MEKDDSIKTMNKDEKYFVGNGTVQSKEKIDIKDFENPYDVKKYIFMARNNFNNVINIFIFRNNYLSK